MKGNYKTLKFYPHLVDLIKSGEKTTTWRLFDDKNLLTKDRIALINSASLIEFANAEIDSVDEVLLKNINKNHFEGHETFLSKEEMIETYKRYYGEEVNEDSVVKVIKFSILEWLA